VRPAADRNATRMNRADATRSGSSLSVSEACLENVWCDPTGAIHEVVIRDLGAEECSARAERFGSPRTGSVRLTPPRRSAGTRPRRPAGRSPPTAPFGSSVPSECVTG
jgi:hypothetical protein